MVSISKINEKFYLNIKENDYINSIEIIEKDPNNENSLKLPENPSNRKFISISKIEKAPNQEYILEYKDKSISHKNGPIERKPLKADIEYLDDDDKILYQSLINKINERKEAEKAERMRENKRQNLINQIENLKKILNEMGD